MPTPDRLTRQWAPRISKPEFREKFPYLDPEETLEGFFNHHISKGDRAYDWNERFLGFAQFRNTRARIEAMEKSDTDSMGLPLDPVKRATMQSTTEGDFGIRFIEALERHQAAGLSFDEAHAAATAELEGESS